MDEQRAYLCIALGVSFIGAFALARVALNSAREHGRASRTYGQAVSLSRGDRLLRNGFKPLLPLARKLVRMRVVGAWTASVSEAAAIKGKETSDLSVCSLAAGACLLLAAAGYLMGSLAAAVAVPCAGVMLITASSNREREKHQDLLRDQLPDALRAMSACFHAGLTLNQTFAQLAHEVPAPLGGVFDEAAKRLQTGSTVQGALESMRERSGLSELSFLSVALQVQHQAGGSMQHVLDATGDALEGELEMKRSLGVQTAQARLSARVVVGVTVLLVIALSVLSDNFLEPFFASALGMAVLGAAVAMQVAGIALVRRLLNVQVD